MHGAKVRRSDFFVEEPSVHSGKYRRLSKALNFKLFILFASLFAVIMGRGIYLYYW
jgi:hypothetical protein